MTTQQPSSYVPKQEGYSAPAPHQPEASCFSCFSEPSSIKYGDELKGYKGDAACNAMNRSKFEKGLLKPPPPAFELRRIGAQSDRSSGLKHRQHLLPYRLLNIKSGSSDGLPELP